MAGKNRNGEEPERIWLEKHERWEVHFTDTGYAGEKIECIPLAKHHLLLSANQAKFDQWKETLKVDSRNVLYSYIAACLNRSGFDAAATYVRGMKENIDKRRENS